VTIKLLHQDGLWRVVSDGLLSESSDLEWAALDALLLAEIYGTTIELGAGVPADALDRARAKREQLEAYRKLLR
jgi:hypothetical protein